MQITNLNISHYKSIRRVNFDYLHNTNIFIGPNNSGKSNVLDAIEYLAMPFNAENYFIDKQANYSMQIQLDSESQKFFNTRENILTAKIANETKSYFVGNQQITDLKLIETFFSQRLVRFNSNLVENTEKIRADYADLKNNYPTNFKKLWQTFRLIFPDIADIISSEEAYTETSQIKAKLKAGGKVVEFSRLGTGVRRVFAIMLYVFHPRYTIVLMNEPEIHLHPALIKKVADLLAKHVTVQQIFITTHSPIFITPANLKQVFRVNKNEEQYTEFYNFTHRDYIDEKRLVQEFNSDNLEMFFTDKVVLVEGVSDRILMRGLIDKFYKKNKEIKVIYVAGKSNVGIYMQLMDIFKIPYLVMLDRDALSGISILEIQKHLPRNIRSQKEQIAYLKKSGIYILPNGTIEKNYPRKYQRRDTKPLNALYALSRISGSDFYSSNMENLREVIEAL